MVIMGLQIEFAALLTTVQIQAIIVFGIVAGCIIILGLGFIYRRDTRNFAAKKRIAEKLKSKGRVVLKDGSRLSEQEISKITKLFSEISAVPGFYVNNNNEYVLESVFVDSLNLIGKDSFTSFSSRLNITENEAEKIVTGLFQNKRVVGVLTLDGKGFVTQKSLIEEIGKQYS